MTLHYCKVEATGVVSTAAGPCGLMVDLREGAFTHLGSAKAGADGSTAAAGRAGEEALVLGAGAGGIAPEHGKGSAAIVPRIVKQAKTAATRRM